MKRIVINYPHVLRLHGCVAQIHKNIDRELDQKLGAGLSQFMILMFISEHPGASQRNISEGRDITPAAVSRHIDSLIRRGMILRDLSEHNRREYELELSEHGKEVLKQSADIINAELQMICNDISDSELSLLDSVFDKFFSAMRKNGGV